MINLAIKLTTDDEIIEKYEIGEIDTATRQLVDKYKNFVYLTALRFVQNHDDAEDIAQDVFIKAWEKIKFFRKESSLKTWLYRITVNFAKNHLRKRRFLSPLAFFTSNEREGSEIEFPERENPDKMEYEEIEEIFLKAVASLPEKQREVFALRYFEEMDYESISKLVGTSIGGLKANYYHAIQKIAKQLEKYLEE